MRLRELGGSVTSSVHDPPMACCERKNLTPHRGGLATTGVVVGPVGQCDVSPGQAKRCD